jgi:hypothetical protein
MGFIEINVLKSHENWRFVHVRAREKADSAARTGSLPPSQGKRGLAATGELLFPLDKGKRLK